MLMNLIRTIYAQRFALGRLGLIAVAVYVAVRVGMSLGQLLAKWYPDAPSAQHFAQYLGVAFVLGSLKTFLDHLPRLYSWIRTGAGDGLYAFSSFILMAAISVMVLPRFFGQLS